MPAENLPLPVLPGVCEAGKVRMRSSGSGYQGSMAFTCSVSLRGQGIGLGYPKANPSLSSLYEVRFLDGETHARAAGPDQSAWTIPEQAGFFPVSLEYAALGVKHIWIGADHLLFVACLVFIATGFRRLVVTITGFTLAHSITLALSALDLLRLPTPPVEAAIALSVVFLAREITSDNQQSLTRRYPVAVSVSFGLLHGFGFAAVLRDIGLPQSELGAALLFFNVGVEVGQLLFIVVALAALGLIRRYPHPVPRPVARLPVYVIGSTASYWFFQRLAAF